MSEEEIIKELDKVINNNKDRTFMTGELNYVAMAEHCKVKILDLQDQLQQKENIIKEVREYIENHSITNMEWWITGEQKIECKFMKDANPQELLEILDKGE